MRNDAQHSGAKSARRAAVVGAGGFLGARLAAGLAQRGWAVRGLVRRPGVRVSGVELVRGDAADPEAVARVASGADCVFVVAAWVHRRARGAEAAAACFAANASIARASAEALSSSVRPWRTVYVSTSAVYGTRFLQARETDPCHPATPYAEGKLAGERLILEAARSAGLPAVVLRPSSIVGPAAPGNVPLLRRASALGWLPLPGGGGAPKSMVHVDTVVEACARVAVVPLRHGTVLNLADPAPVTPREVALALAASRGDRLRVTSLPVGAARLVTRTWDSTLGGRAGIPPLGAFLDTWLAPAVVDVGASRARLGDYVVLGALESLGQDA
ncbi:MAG: NAD-dependent epimerase/dehydratase family protein [Polyangiaceae bacterium]|nr:NAD-dependent epimerase/dehydratase family protein [Polyangiaceae bacterium]